MQHKLTDVALGASALSLTLLFFLPVSIYLLNREDILASDVSMLTTLLCASGAGFVVLTAVLLLMRGRLRAVGVSLVAFLASAVWVQANIFNWNYGLLDGSELAWQLIEWRSFVDIAMWTLAFCGALFWGLYKKRSFKTLFVALLFVQCCNLAYVFSVARTQDLEADRQLEEQPKVPVNKFNFSTEKNIIVLILDSYQTDVFLETLETDPRLEDTLRGFTFYPDALGAYVSTRLTVPLLLTGEMYTNQTRMNLHLRDKHGSYSLVEALQNHGYTAGVYPYWPSTYRYELGITAEEDEELAIRDYKEFYQVATLTLFRMAPHVLKPQALAYASFDENMEEDRDLFMYEMQHSTRATLTEPRLNWYHLKGLHFNWVLDGNRLRYRDRGNALLIAERLNDLIVAFMEQLQALDVYDNSAILIIADHGNGYVAYEDNTLAEMSAIVEENACFNMDTVLTQERKLFRYSWERALPMVLVKPFNATDSFSVSCAPVSLADIYPTILDMAGIEHERDLPGVSILNLEPETERLRNFYFYYYAERSKRPGGYFSPLYEYEVSGFCWHEDSYAYSGYVYEAGERRRLPLQPYSVGTSLRFGPAGSGIQYLDDNWRREKDGHDTIGDEATITLLLEDVDYDLSLQMEAAPFLVPGALDKQRVKLYAGSVLLEAFDISEKTVLRADISEEHLAEDHLVLRLELPDCASPQEYNLSDDEDELALRLLSLQLDARE